MEIDKKVMLVLEFILRCFLNQETRKQTSSWSGREAKVNKRNIVNWIVFFKNSDEWEKRQRVYFVMYVYLTSADVTLNG